MAKLENKMRSYISSRPVLSRSLALSLSFLFPFFFPSIFLALQALQTIHIVGSTRHTN